MKTLIALVLCTLSIQLSQAQSSAMDADFSAIENLKAAAKTLSTHDLSCKKTSDCGLLAIGSKACGGPAGFLLVSSKNKNLTEISYLADKTIEREEAFNSTYGVFSDCSMTMPIQPTCSKNQCVLK